MMFPALTIFSFSILHQNLLTERVAICVTAGQGQTTAAHHPCITGGWQQGTWHQDTWQRSPYRGQRSPDSRSPDSTWPVDGSVNSQFSIQRESWSHHKHNPALVKILVYWYRLQTTDILQRTLFPIRELRQGRDQGKRLSQKLENSSNTRYQSFM